MRKLYLKKEEDISEIEKVFSNPLTIGFDEDCWCQSGYKRGFLTLSKKYCNVYSDRIFVDVMPFRFNFKFWGSQENEKTLFL